MFFELGIAHASPIFPDVLNTFSRLLLGLWKEKHLVSRRLLAYDTTNFYTYITSTNTRVNPRKSMRESKLSSKETGELRKTAFGKNFSVSQSESMTLLVATPGQLVTREQLKEALWPGDTFGDFELG